MTSGELIFAMSYFELQPLGFEQSNIDIRLENIAESECSRKCGTGVQVRGRQRYGNTEYRYAVYRFCGSGIVA